MWFTPRSSPQKQIPEFEDEVGPNRRPVDVLKGAQTPANAVRVSLASQKPISSNVHNVNI
jgi:hypothetical protein